MGLVVWGLVGQRLDQAGSSADRWRSWRPTVALCQHEELLVERLELLHDSATASLAQQLAEDLASVSPETEVRLHALSFRDPWDFEEVYGQLAEFARRYPFQPESEEYLVNITTGTHVQQICWFLLTESRHVPGRLIQASPPPRGLPGKGSYSIIDLDLSRYDQLAARFAQEQRTSVSFLKSGIETRNAAFNALIERIERVAVQSTAPLLLIGPTGAGKSQLARRIYELKQQRRQLAGPFVEVNCATLRGDHAMSTLFGHEKGAFTGATTRRDGLLRAAHHGMLFLDEIGELGLDEQSMLLRAIEEQRFLPLGADQEVQTEFQLIAGTNRDLPLAVAQGTFREDLLARINLWTFALPGLAERREDIAPNLQYELHQYAARTGHVVRLNKEALAQFLAFAESDQATWRANFRDLNAAVTRMATLAAGGRITTELVQEEIERLAHHWRELGPRLRSIPSSVSASNVSASNSAPSNSVASSVSLSSLINPAELDLFDQIQLEGVVRVCRASSSLSDAGRKLFAVSRRQKTKLNDADRLRKFLARFQLSWESLRLSSPTNPFGEA